ncbi:Protein TOO MANY MOUTHS [Forsythia ovata]|uniref:Protein TOO MANY MOUTHS n=1 Tax=Forsythia ovata TaxID=205694 RepID=A0ABD1T5U1_9LAMI
MGLELGSPDLIPPVDIHHLEQSYRPTDSSGKTRIHGNIEDFTIILPDSAQLEGPQLGSSMANSGAKTDLREQEAVYDIMRAIGNGWATDIPDVYRGRWHGIECMPDNDNVYHVVSLSFGSLSDDTAFPTCDPTRSSISPSITKLLHLRTLFFYRCFSYNPQPILSFLGRLGSGLQTLVLRENGHIGSIPHELRNLTSLKVLDLHNNNSKWVNIGFTGPDFWSKFIRLEW